MTAVWWLVMVVACDSRHVQVSWHVKNARTGELVPCPRGAKVNLYVSRWDEHVISDRSGALRWGNGKTELHGVHDCRDGMAITDELSPPDDDTRYEYGRDLDEGFEISVTLTTEAGAPLARSTRAFRYANDLSDAHVELAPAGGYFAFRWKKYTSWGTYSWCAGARALRVNVEGADHVGSDIIDCLSEEVRHPLWVFTHSYPAGAYRVWVDALDESWQVIEGVGPDGVPQRATWTATSEQLLLPGGVHILE